MARDTGFPDADAENDFQRMRRHAELARLTQWFTRQPADVNAILPFDEVVAALGRTGETYLGLQTVEVASIVGSVDRTKDFDRYFRPTSARIRSRWQRLAAAQRRVNRCPRCGCTGSVGCISSSTDTTASRSPSHDTSTPSRPTSPRSTPASPPRASMCPATSSSRTTAACSSHGCAVGCTGRHHPVRRPFDYAELAEAVEAWGFRLSQEVGEFLGRTEVARRWFGEEFLPVIRMARRADVRSDLDSDAELYLWLACERYRLVRKHIWDDEIIDELREQPRRRRR